MTPATSARSCSGVVVRVHLERDRELGVRLADVAEVGAGVALHLHIKLFRLDPLLRDILYDTFLILTSG